MRRAGSLVTAAAIVLVGTAWSVRSVSGSVARELSAREQAAHVLNRLAFGARPGEIDRVVAMGVDRWIDQQLRPDRVPDRDLEQVMAAYPALRMSSGDLLQEYPPAAVRLVQRRLRGDTMLTREDSMELRRDAQRNREFVSDLLSAKVARAVMSERQLAEVMTDFWENHFNVFIGKGQLRYYLPEYSERTIRPYALGRFRDLLGAVAKSPAMLLYLDNAQSVADSGRPTLGGGGFARGRVGRAIVNRRIQRMDSAQRAMVEQVQQRRPRGLNENYARELLELHTLGVDGGYTQQDVIEVARALTGWGVNPPRQAGRGRGAQGGDGFVFRPQAHDAGAKLVLGHKLKAGRGIEDGEEVLDIVSRHPSTAMFISRKLVTRLVSDEPPQDLVERAAATFRRTDGDIREVVRTIVTSAEFFSRPAYRSKVKSPFEVTVSALRALGARADTTPFSASLVGRLGQPLYGHQAPNGWPETGAAWINTGAILNRINLGIVVASGRVPGAPLRGWPPFATLARAPRTEQVDSVIASFLSGRASPETREILASGNNPLMARAAADSTMLDDTAAAMGMERGRVGGGGGGRGGRQGGFQRLPQLTGLPQVIGLALGSPEFQRR
jgi:uncharacterized protein (DUF1800 family)